MQKHRGFAIPVPLWVVGQFFEALTDLAWVGESVIRRVPLPKDEAAHKQLNWVKSISPSGVIAATHTMLKDLSQYKGLEIFDVEAGEVHVKVSIK